MDKFIPGDYVLVANECRFYKIEGVAKSGSLLRMHLKSKNIECQANGFNGGNSFLIRGEGKPFESNVFTLNAVIQTFGWISLIFVLLFFSIKIFG